MTKFQSKIDTGSESFARNRETMLELVGKMRGLEDRAAAKSEEPPVEAAAQTTEQQPQQAQEKPQRQAEKPADDTNKSGKSRSRGRRDDRRDDKVVGMGDHMPSFIALSFEERRAS